MRSVRLFLIVAVLGITPCAQAKVSGVEKLGGTFEIHGHLYVAGDYNLDPPDPYPPYSESFDIIQNEPVSHALEYMWDGLDIGVSCEASYERVAAISFIYNLPAHQNVTHLARSDYLFRPEYSCAYDVAFSGFLVSVVPPDCDRLKVYLADTTAGDVLIDVDEDFYGRWAERFTWGWLDQHTETLRFQFDDSHTYRLEVLVEPYGIGGNADARGFGEMNISITPIPVPGAALLATLGTSLVAWLCRRKTL